MVKRLSLFLLFLLLFVGSVVQAHTVTEVGDYALIASWENEPPVVGEWNAIRISIFNAAEGEVNSTDVTLRQFELVNGETTTAAAPSKSFDETVNYSVSFMPTVEGEIGVHLVGTLEGEPFDVTVYPESVEPVSIVQFPNLTLSNRQLQDALISLEDQLAAQRIQLLIAYVIGGAGLIVGIVGAIGARRK